MQEKTNSKVKSGQCNTGKSAAPDLRSNKPPQGMGSQGEMSQLHVRVCGGEKDYPKNKRRDKGD